MVDDATILEARALAFLDRPRGPEAKAWHLPDEEFCDAVKAELEGIAFRKIRAQLAATLPEGKVPERSAWSEFTRSFRPFLRIARRRAAASGADEVEDEAAKSPAGFDAATLKLIKQLAFELADSTMPNVDAIKSLVMLLGKHEDRLLKERQVAVSERKMALLESQSAEAKKALGDATLTPEKRDERMREIFGMPTTSGGAQ